MSSPTPDVSWRFLLDENMPRLLGSPLRLMGYEVENVLAAGLAGRPEDKVWAYAQAQDETLITRDKDFADIRRYPTPHAGIVIVDIHDEVSIGSLIQFVTEGLASLTGQSLANAVITISLGRVRVRR